LDSALAGELELARIAAGRAAAEIRGRWRSGGAVRFKGPIDPVTEADLAAERIILDVIRSRFPDDRILAEESGLTGDVPPDTHAGGRRWFVDPLDGTTNFSHGLPHFCVSIASADADGPRVGVIVDPVRRWTFDAVRGGGARLDGQPIGVSVTRRVDRAILATGFPYDRHTAKDNNSARFSRALRMAQGLRRAGSAALDLAFVAAGWLDGYWEYRLNPWDLAAGALLVREAGGRVSTPGGGPWYVHDADIVATNGALHPRLLALLAGGGTRSPDPEDQES